MVQEGHMTKYNTIGENYIGRVRTTFERRHYWIYNFISALLKHIYYIYTLTQSKHYEVYSPRSLLVVS